MEKTILFPFCLPLPFTVILPEHWNTQQIQNKTDGRPNNKLASLVVRNHDPVTHSLTYFLTRVTSRAKKEVELPNRHSSKLWDRQLKIERSRRSNILVVKNRKINILYTLYRFKQIRYTLYRFKQILYTLYRWGPQKNVCTIVLLQCSIVSALKRREIGLGRVQFAKQIVQKDPKNFVCIFSKCTFAKWTRLSHILSFASLFQLIKAPPLSPLSLPPTW